MRLIAAAAVAAVLTLAACGDDGGGSVEDDVRDAARATYAAVFSGDVAATLASMTPCTAEELQAVQGIVPMVEQSPRAEVTGVEITSLGDVTATVSVSAKRGDDALGASPPTRLTKVGDQWLVECASLANS